MRIRRFVALALPLVLLAVAVAVVRARPATGRFGTSGAAPAAAQGPAQGAATFIEAPSDWVAFSAEFAKGLPGQEKVTGRYVQSSNGSTRLDTGPVGEAPRLIFIKNVPQATYYSRLIAEDGTGPWVAGPMTLPPDGWKPMQMTAEPGRRIVLRDKVEGFTVVQIASSGAVTLFAPALNFHPLIVRYSTTGYEEIYRHVKLGEPAADLFVPPPGAEVRRSETPDGIVFTAARESGGQK